MSQETKVAIGTGVGSGVIAAISTYLAWTTARALRKANKS